MTETKPRIGGQIHMCMYLWPSPIPPDNPDGQVYLCWHKSKWYPPGQGSDKSCPFADNVSAKECELFVARKAPTQAESNTKIAIASIKEKQGDQYWTGSEVEGDSISE